METKPESNLSEKKNDPSTSSDRIIIYGDVGHGANIGNGTHNIDYLAGGDMTIGVAQSEDHTRFADLLTGLQSLIDEAQQGGEIDKTLAEGVKKELEAAAELIRKEEKPPKKKVLGRLQYVADVLDAAVDSLTGEGASGPAKMLMKALPMVALLIKLASRMF